MELQTYITAHCQATTVKYNGRDYSVQSDKNGFRYIKVSYKGKRVIIPIKEEIVDVVFDYVFNGTFKTKPDKILDMCVLLRIREDPEKTFLANKARLGIQGSFSDFKKTASEMNRKFKQENTIY